MLTYTVLLTDNTTGTVDYRPMIGSMATVTLSDENGNKIEREGIVADILQEN